MIHILPDPIRENHVMQHTFSIAMGFITSLYV